MAYSGSSYWERITTPVPGWRLANLFRRLDAFVLKARRHADVGDDNLGLHRIGALDQLVVVRSHAHDLEIGLPREEGLDTLPDDRRIIG